jgi:hypothetical protein
MGFERLSRANSSRVQLRETFRHFRVAGARIYATAQRARVIHWGQLVAIEFLEHLADVIRMEGFVRPHHS